MHEHVLHVIHSWLAIGLSAQAGQSLVCKVGFDRVIALDKNVETQVKLFALKQERRFDVALHKHILLFVRENIFGDVFKFGNQNDTFAPTPTRWLSNEEEPGVLFHVLLQSLTLFWHEERDR